MKVITIKLRLDSKKEKQYEKYQIYNIIGNSPLFAIFL